MFVLKHISVLTTKTDTHIQVYHGSYRQTALLRCGTPAHRKPWRGEFLVLQTEPRSKVWLTPSLIDQSQTEAIPEWDEKHPHTQNLPDPQVLATLCELTPCRCSVGKPWNTCRTRPTSSWFMWWGMKSSFSPIIRPDSTCVRTMWSILSQRQTQASFVRMFCRINRDQQSPHTHTLNASQSKRLLPVFRVAFANHTHLHTFNIHPLFIPHTHTCLQYRLPSHTLTTYCLASKAYVGWPRVLFMSSLW